MATHELDRSHLFWVFLFIVAIFFYYLFLSWLVFFFSTHVLAVFGFWAQHMVWSLFFTFVLIVAGLFCSMNAITRVPFSSGAIHLHALMLQMHIHTYLRKEHIRGMDFSRCVVGYIYGYHCNCFLFLLGVVRRMYVLLSFFRN